MKLLLALPLLALPLAGCSPQAQADATAVAGAICSSAAQLQASGLQLNQTQATAVQAVVNGCNATAEGTSLTQASAVAAIFAGLVTLQQGGLLASIKMKALAPDELDTLQRQTLLPKSTVDWLVTHDLR